MSRSRRPLLLAGMLAAAAAAWAAVALVAPAPARSASGTDALKDKPAPDFELPTLTGDRTVKLSGFAGKVVFVDFWASWCEPCKKELPALQKMHDALGAAGLVVLAISLDEEPSEARLFTTRHKLTLPLLSDVKGKVADRYKLAKMPTSVVIDKAGVIRFVNAGFDPGDEKELEAQVRKLL